jgi:hypothetical protein
MPAWQRIIPNPEFRNPVWCGPRSDLIGVMIHGPRCDRRDRRGSVAVQIHRSAAKRTVRSYSAIAARWATIGEDSCRRRNGAGRLVRVPGLSGG